MHVKRHMSHGGRPTMAGCPDPLDLSPLLFRPPSADPRSAPAGLEAPLPYVGPVRVARGAAAKILLQVCIVPEMRTTQLNSVQDPASSVW